MVFREQYEYAIERSKNRLSDNPFVQLIDEQATGKSRQDDVLHNYANYLKRNEERDQKAEKFEKLKDFESILSFKPLPEDLPLIQKDEVSKENVSVGKKALGKIFMLMRPLMLVT